MSAEARFRVGMGTMIVIPTAEEAAIRPVKLIYDRENDAYGIMLIGESPVKGYVFLVPREELEANREQGKAQDHLRY